MTALITLTTAGADSGPFNLYSNLDGYATAFEVAVPKVDLLAGYASSLVPDFTTTVRVLSTGTCTNYIDIILAPLPTTTTTSSSSTTTSTSTSSSSTTTTTTTLACGCFEIETNISQIDLDDATGNTDPLLDNLVNFFFLDCNGIFSQKSYTVAGTYYSTDTCTNDPLNILSFRYMKNDVEITTVVSTASLSINCCSTTTTTTTVTPIP